MTAVDALWASWLGELPHADARAAVEQAIVAAARDASAAHPTISLSPSMYFAYVGARLEDTNAIASTHLDDLWLACAALDGGEEAVAEFEHRFVPIVQQATRRTISDPDLAEDVVQELRTQLLLARNDRPGALATYAGRSALASWLAIVALRHARRATKTQPTLTEGDAIVAAEAMHNPELVAIKREHARAFAEAFEHAMRGLSLRDRSALRFHLVEGLTIDQIGAMHSVHRATAARWIAAARTRVHDALRAELRLRIKLTRRELESLIRVARSQLDFSITRHLAR